MDQHGNVIRRLGGDQPEFAAWSPDGERIACAYSKSDFSIWTRTGRTVWSAHLPDDSGIPMTGLGWAGPEALWDRISGHANSVISFWKPLKGGNSNPIEVIGQPQFADECALAPDQKTAACRIGNGIFVGGSRAYPASWLDPANRVASVDVEVGGSTTTGTSPKFQIAIRSSDAEKTELQVTPEGGSQQIAYLRTKDDFLSLEAADDEWFFAAAPLDSRRQKFRVALFRDASGRAFHGVAWDPSGSKVITCETSRAGSALLIITKEHGGWRATRILVKLAGTEITLRRVEPNGRSALVESAGAVYRCALDGSGACTSTGNLIPSMLGLHLSGTIVPTQILDWYCPPIEERK